MRILSLDTASPFPSLALRDGAGPVLARPLPPNAAEVVPSAVTALLGEASLSVRDLERIVVLSGPGSFTGLRAGLSFARGLARARGLPLALVGTFAAADEAMRSPSDVLFVLDAGRGDVHSASRVGGILGRTEPPRARENIEAGARESGLPVIDLDRAALPLAAAACRVAGRGDVAPGILVYGRKSAAEEKWSLGEGS